MIKKRYGNRSILRFSFCANGTFLCRNRASGTPAGGARKGQNLPKLASYTTRPRSQSNSGGGLMARTAPASAQASAQAVNGEGASRGGGGSGSRHAPLPTVAVAGGAVSMKRQRKAASGGHVVGGEP